MDLIQAKTGELIDFIRRGKVYSRYREAEKVLAQKSELKAWMNEFRSRMYRMNNDGSEVDLFDEVDRVEQEYRDLRKIPEVNEYLEAELELCKLFKKVEMQINQELDFSIPKL